MIRKIRSGNIFFYRENGAPSTVFTVVLKEAVQGGVLQGALDQAIGRYSYLKVRICQTGSELVLEDNGRPMIARRSPADIPLGSKENGYHVIDVHYYGDRIFVNAHHGVCDGNGILPFIRTLLYCYLKSIYGEKGRLGMIRLPSSPLYADEEAEPCPETRYRADAPAPRAGVKPLYTLPEIDGGAKQSYKWEMKIDLNEILPIIKSNDGSPSALLSLCVCKAIVRIHPDHDGAVAASVAWDIRKALGLKHTHKMCLSSFRLDYDEKLRGLPLDMQLTAFRGRMIAQGQTENAMQACNGMIGLCNMLDGMKTLREKCELIGKATSGGVKTFLVSYVGKLALGDYEQYVDSLFVYGSGTKGLVLEVCSVNDTLCVQYIQSFPGTAYLDCFLDEMSKLGIHAVPGTCERFSTPNAAFCADECAM